MAEQYIYSLQDGWKAAELIPVESGRLFDFSFMNMPAEVHLFDLGASGAHGSHRFRVIAGLGDAGLEYEAVGLPALAASIRELTPLLRLEWRDG